MSAAVTLESVVERFDSMKSEYRAARQTRFSSRIRGISRSGSNADYHYASELDYLFMVERARHFERDDPLLGQAIRRLVANVVQGGFQPDPQTGDKDLNKALKDAWWQWAMDADQCHSEGEMTFPEIERLMLHSTIRDGDVFAILSEEGSIQAVEGHRPRTPRRTQRNVVHGILLDDNAKRKEVWLSKENIGYWTLLDRVSDIQPYPFRDETGMRVVLQVYLPNRFSQRRGVTALAPVSEIAGMSDDLQFTTLVKAQLASLIFLIRTQDVKTLNPDNGPPLGVQNLNNPIAPAGISQLPGVMAGMDITLPPGMDANISAPNIPSSNHFEHTMLLWTLLAVNLDLPLQVMLLDPQRSNFSAWRGAIDQARMRFRVIQDVLTSRFHAPTWRWKVSNFASESSALRKMIGNNPLWQACYFKPPRFAYIDPAVDTKADAMMSDKFLSSPTRIQAARGEDWDEVAAEIVRDRTTLILAAMEAAKTLQANDPDISWRDILSPLLGATANGQSQPDQAADDTQEISGKPTKKKSSENV